MGIQSLIKSTFAPIKKNNSTNARLGRELDRRVTEIAADLERSPDPEKEEKLKRIANTVAEGFTIDPGKDDATCRLEPIQFLKRQEIILNADNQLDEIKSPSPNRRETMKNATMKDYKSLEHEIKKLSDVAVTTLVQITNLLPARRDMLDPWACQNIKQIVSEQTGINDLQSAIVQFGEKLETMKDQGLIDRNLIVTVYKLEEPESDPTVHTISMDNTFGELAEAMMEAGDDDDNDVPPVDVWIKKRDPVHNCVTQSCHWWEYQTPDIRVRDAFPGEKDGCKVDVVAKNGEYVVALIEDNGREKCKAVEMTKNKQVAHEHIRRVFKDRQVLKILKLADGSDISNLIFHRNYIKPHTNPIYIQLDVVHSNAPDATAVAEHSSSSNVLPESC